MLLRSRRIGIWNLLPRNGQRKLGIRSRLVSLCFVAGDGLMGRMELMMPITMGYILIHPSTMGLHT